MSCKMGNFMNLRVFALLGVLLLAGCSGLSVRHLPSNPWKNEASQNIQMRYLAFQYQVCLLYTSSLILRVLQGLGRAGGMSRSGRGHPGEEFTGGRGRPPLLSG